MCINQIKYAYIWSFYLEFVAPMRKYGAVAFCPLEGARKNGQLICYCLRMASPEPLLQSFQQQQKTNKNCQHNLTTSLKDKLVLYSTIIFG